MRFRDTNFTEKLRGKLYIKLPTKIVVIKFEFSNSILIQIQ